METILRTLHSFLELLVLVVITDFVENCSNSMEKTKLG
jgi:hypothetical protein